MDLFKVISFMYLYIELMYGYMKFIVLGKFICFIMYLNKFVEIIG